MIVNFIWRVLAASCGGCFHDVVGDGVELIDLYDAFDLGEESVDEAKIAARDAGDRGDGLGVGVVVGVQGLTEFALASFKDKAQFFLSQGSAKSRQTKQVR